MNVLYVDLETYSPIDIKRGTYRYTEESEILLVAFASNKDPVTVMEGNEGADYLKQFIKSHEFCAHNSNFDRNILEHYSSDFRKIKWRDTMVRALSHGLPGGLDLLSQIFRLPEGIAKDRKGKQLMHLFCKPQKDGSRFTKETNPQEWAEFKKYAGADIEAMRALDRLIPCWNNEYHLWLLDQKINDRGFAVDIELAKAAIEAVKAEKEKNDSKTKELTDGTIGAATQRDALLKHILEVYGVELPDMQSSTLQRRLDDPDLPDPVKELLSLRLESSKTSIKKYEVLVNSVCNDGRLKGTLQFCGANRTRRWGGRLFQPQNLPRPKFKAAEVEKGIGAIKSGCADLLYESVNTIASSALRGAIVAPIGKKLVVSDLSAIEGRKLAWLAGEEWKLKAYADYDRGIGFDMYVLTYARTFSTNPEEVEKKQRQLGKVLELALGYGGGAGAFYTFAKGYNVDLNDLLKADIPVDVKKEAEEFYEYALKNRKTHGLEKEIFIACDAIKRMWRKANPNIVQFWRDLEDACFGAILYGRETTLRRGMAVDKKGTWLRIKLPSGGYLCYAGAKIEEKKIRYLGINQYTRKWCKLSTYGGKLAENVTQASSRDILATGMIIAEQCGYETVLSVHDELITEVIDGDAYSEKGLSKILSTPPAWAYGLPLAAAGFESKRYKKED